MTYELEIAGVARRVVIEPIDDARVRVALDGRPPREYDVMALPGDRLSLVDLVSGHSHELGFAPGAEPGDILAYLRGVVVAARAGSRRSRDGVSAQGPVRIVAPMPGKVVRVLVAAGDRVRARQPLVVVEAMKMENELSAPRDGIVHDILVTPGTSVEAGRLLATVE